jgi:carnitine monooxygenase subunit
VRGNQNDFLWPNFATLDIPGQGNLLVYTITPVSHGETLACFRYLLDPSMSDEEAKPLTAFANDVGWEDVGLIEPAQRGVASNTVTKGLLVPDEGQVTAFQGSLREAISRTVD